MQSVLTTTLGLAWEVAERAETLCHRANANQDSLQSILGALSRVRAVLKDQQDVGVRYNEYYLELLQDVIELCNEASAVIERHLNRHWMMQYFHAKNATIELTRISNALHSRIDMLHNCVSESLHTLVQEYYQIVLDDSGNSYRETSSVASLADAQVDTPPEPPRRVSMRSSSEKIETPNNQGNDYNIKHMKTLRRQTRVLSVILPQLQAVEDMQLPTDDEHHNTETIEKELSQVKARLSQLEDLFNRESIVIDSSLMEEMVSLQHRALDLMKVLYAREKAIAAVDYPQMDGENPINATPSGYNSLEIGVIGCTTDISNSKVFISSADVVSSSTVSAEGAKYTVYNIEVANSIGQRWRISRRFNDFYVLDIQIRKIVDGKLQGELPQLPPKTLYNMSEAVVTARLEALHQYVTTMLRNSIFSQLEAFTSFLHPSAETVITTSTNNKPFIS